MMGMMMQQPLKNYTIPTIAQNKIAEPQRTKSQIPFYTSSAIKEVFEVPCYSLKTKKNVDLSTIQSQIYQKPESLRLVTYNVWFQSFNTQARYPIILQLLADSDADVICLQEVNQQFNNLLHSPSGKYKKLQNYYIPMMKMHWYDTVILTKYPCRFYKKIFSSSSMGRCSLTAVLQLAEGKEKKMSIGINCVHLESLNYPQERVNQIKQIEEMNTKFDMSIIAGDFNFSDGWKEDKAIQGYVDVWKRGKRYESRWVTEEQRKTGFTMPTNKKFPAWRPDHIIYRSKLKKGEQNHDQIETIGDFTVPPFEEQNYAMISLDNQVRCPSDHFGIIAKIQL